SSGVGVRDAAVEAFQDLKLKKRYRYIVYKITDDFKEITTERMVENSEYNDFVASLPANECRYCVYDFEYEVPGEGPRNKIVFIFWAPDTAKVKAKMLYAASKEAIRKKLDGIYTELQCTDLSEVSHDSIMDKVSR
ncbi:cofilin, partial [Quaeritorhiza haematococci]